MKKALLTILVLMFGATVVFGQNGTIGIFGDSEGIGCGLPGDPGLLYVYFVHVWAVGATGSQWAAPAPECVTAVRLADVPVFSVNLGNTADGITIGYGTCKTGTFHIMTALYSVTSASPCCWWFVVADPNLSSGMIEIPDCQFNLTYGIGGLAIINPSPPMCICSVPTEDTTWGQVKVLYSE